MKGIARRSNSSITLYDPEKGLKTIAVAEAGETYWARAKDLREMLKAAEAKIKAQAEYVVWRDSAIVHGKGPGRGHKGKKEISVQKSLLPAADPGDVTAHRWRKWLCAKNGKGTQIDQTKFEAAFGEAALRCARACENAPKGTERGTAGTGEFERYTPAKYIEAARTVLGTIDLDPATSKQAQRIIKAEKFFTVKDDGLAQEWHGNIWLNPPYHRDLAPKFIQKLADEYAAERVKAAIMLTNNCTDTDWFVVALRACATVCFTHGRINFAAPNGSEVLPTQGQAFFYFGVEVDRFEETFCRIGACLRPSRYYEGGKD